MKNPKRAKKQVFPHDSKVWDKLAQIIKVEGPITWEKVKYWAPDVPALEVDRALREMTETGVLSVAREWKGSRMIETYFYGR